jgi:pilus assembly protein CpaE
MAERIKVLIVDDIPETREHLTKLLGFESDMDVVGAAASGEEALDVAAKVLPDIVLMDINMPGMDGIATTELMASRVPTAAIVMMSVQGEADYLRRSMLAGAREFLVKPFSSDELAGSIRQVYIREREKQGRLDQKMLAISVATGNGAGSSLPVAYTVPAPSHEPRQGVVITVFSPKGGVGRTTLAVNIAVAAAQELGKKVVLVDGSFQFGDVGVLLNLNPRSKSIADLIPEMAAGEVESLDSVLVHHSTGIDVLLAPPSPEMAELITTDYVRKVVQRLRDTHDLVIVDSWPWFHDTTLSLLDMSDQILAVLTLEITNIKSIRLFLEVASQLGYSHEKIQLVLNRADSAYGIRVADVEHSIGRKIDHTVVSDGRTVVYALNRGVPFVASNRQAQVSQDIVRLVKAVVGERVIPSVSVSDASPQRKSLFAWR